MAKSPEIALLISSHQRPAHLKWALLSVALQQGVQGKIELVVTDDGSEDETAQVVEAFARTVDFPVRMTTHRHHGFHLSRCRNEGVAASEAPYLLFTDGDCILPPDHVAKHLRHRRRGRVIAGDCYRLDRADSARVTAAAIRSGAYRNWVGFREQMRIARKAACAKLYHLLRHPTRPRLTGCNIAVWRDDFLRVNGFDENYLGWGLEDQDFRLRLSRLGLRFKSILGSTAAYHLWHPLHPTFARNSEGTTNLRYYQRALVPTCCENGFVKQRPVPIVIVPPRSHLVRQTSKEPDRQRKPPPQGDVTLLITHRWPLPQGAGFFAGDHRRKAA
jgi:glycosyltransferase involved in cell wall biosynthesis